MASKAAVGHSNLGDSKKAGIEAARAALARADFGADKITLALLSSTSKHDPASLRDGVREVIGSSSRLIGGYAVGIITNDWLSYGGTEVGLMLVSSDTMRVDMDIVGGLTGNELATGRELGKKIASREYDGEPNLLLMYDSVRSAIGEGGFSLNLATPLLQGMKESMPTMPRTAGVGLLGDMQFQPTFQWFDDRIEQNSAMGLVLSGGVRMDTIIMHGCKPSGGYHAVTKADGTALLELDGRRALDVVAEMLGPDAGKTWEDYPLFVTLGVNRGDKFGVFDEEKYANRLCMGIDKDRGALIMFEPDLTVGTEVQFMRRSIDFDYIGRRTSALFERIEGRKPFAAVYIDCAGRASAYCATEREEAEAVQKAIGAVPLLGVYSGVEVARVGQDLQPLDWTGVLCLLSE